MVVNVIDIDVDIDVDLDIEIIYIYILYMPFWKETSPSPSTDAGLMWWFFGNS